MELSDLHIFRTVVRTGGIIRAAEELHRVQSNVSVRIKMLEEKLGVALFTRVGRGLRLSAAGHVLIRYADKILALADEVTQAMQNDPCAEGILRLGTMESTAAVRLPSIIGKFHDLYPRIALELHTGDPFYLAARVRSGELDAAFVADPVAEPCFGVISAFVEELVIVADAQHPPIGSPQDIKKRTLLAFHPGCPYRSRFEEWFTRRRITPDFVVELESYQLILGCAVAGMGVALVPRSVIETYVGRSQMSIHKLGANETKSRTDLIWHKENQSPATSAFIELVVSATRNFAIRS